MGQVEPINNADSQLDIDPAQTVSFSSSPNNDLDPDIGSLPEKNNINPVREFEIPQNYGDNKIVLMVRDPFTIYSYWEIKDSVERELKSEIDRRGLTPVKSILRVYNVTDTGISDDLQGVMDFELRDWVSTWYVHTGNTGGEWMVDIGILCDSGDFFCLARSNVVRAPKNTVSDVIGDEWMPPEGDQDPLKNWLSSGGISSGMFGSLNLFENE